MLSDVLQEVELLPECLEFVAEFPFGLRRELALEEPESRRDVPDLLCHVRGEGQLQFVLEGQRIEGLLDLRGGLLRRGRHLAESGDDHVERPDDGLIALGDVGCLFDLLVCALAEISRRGAGRLRHDLESGGRGGPDPGQLPRYPSKNPGDTGNRILGESQGLRDASGYRGDGHRQDLDAADHDLDRAEKDLRRADRPLLELTRGGELRDLSLEEGEAVNDMAQEFIDDRDDGIRDRIAESLEDGVEVLERMAQFVGRGRRLRREDDPEFLGEFRLLLESRRTLDSGTG